MDIEDYENDTSENDERIIEESEEELYMKDDQDDIAEKIRQ